MSDPTDPGRAFYEQFADKARQLHPQMSWDGLSEKEQVMWREQAAVTEKRSAGDDTHILEGELPSLDRRITEEIETLRGHLHIALGSATLLAPHIPYSRDLIPHLKHALALLPKPLGE